MPIYYVKPDSDNQFPDKETTEAYVAPTTEATTISTTN